MLTVCYGVWCLWSSGDYPLALTLALFAALMLKHLPLRTCGRAFLAGSAFFDLVLLPGAALPYGTLPERLPHVLRVSLYLLGAAGLAGLLGAWRVPIGWLPGSGLWARRMAGMLAVTCLAGCWGWDGLLAVLSAPRVEPAGVGVVLGSLGMLGLYCVPLIDVASRGWERPRTPQGRCPINA